MKESDPARPSPLSALNICVYPRWLHLLEQLGPKGACNVKLKTYNWDLIYNTFSESDQIWGMLTLINQFSLHSVVVLSACLEDTRLSRTKFPAHISLGYCLLMQKTWFYSHHTVMGIKSCFFFLLDAGGTGVRFSEILLSGKNWPLAWKYSQILILSFILERHLWSSTPKSISQNTP